MATDTDNDIIILADIWPVTDILAHICLFFGQYPSISIDIWPISRVATSVADTDLANILVSAKYINSLIYWSIPSQQQVPCCQEQYSM